MPKEHRITIFMGTLKDNIQHEVHVWEPNSLETTFKVEIKFENKIMAAWKYNTHNYKYGSVVSPSLPQPTRLTPQKLDVNKAKGLCYSCPRKYTKGHNYAEKKLFYIDCEEEEEKEQ